MSAGKRVVVVGSGVIGAACAHYLSRSGWQVTVIDQGAFGHGCSYGNCGFVCPSHVLPLAAPGAIRQALGALVRPNSPFRIKPRLDPALWAWLLKFARRCNRRDMVAAGHGIQALLDSSRRLYDELVQGEGLACEWEERGLLFVYQTRAALEHYAETDQLLRETFGRGAERYDGAAVNELEPALLPGLAGGWLYRTDAHLRPDVLMASWQESLQKAGVTVREHCAFQGFVEASSQAAAARTAEGEVPAEAFVLATGAWTPLVGTQLGCPIPIQPGKGYSITMTRPAVCPVLPIIFEEHRVAVTPMRSGYRIGSTMEFAGYDTSLNPKRLDLLRDAARLYLRDPLGEPVGEPWYGWRPMTYDSLPLIDRSPRLGNVVVAAGHNMLGLSMAPATGKLVAEMLGGHEPHLDPAPYRVARFG